MQQHMHLCTCIMKQHIQIHIYIAARFSCFKDANHTLDYLNTKKSTYLQFLVPPGHSLGGAMACLAALSIRFSVGPDVALNVTSFGAPKMGNFTFKRFYNMVMPSTFRFVNVRDLVPALKNLCTRHQLQNVGHEVVLDFKKGNLIVAPNFIERALLLKFRTYSPQHHFVSRYALALMVWTARAHPEFQPVWSLDLCNGVTISCSESLEDLDDVTKRTIRKQVQRAGVEWKVKGEVLLRDMETQTEGLCECPPLELVSGRFVVAHLSHSFVLYMII